MHIIILPPAAIIVAPTATGAASLLYGRIVRQKYWNLPKGGVFEFESSGDGATWQHHRPWFPNAPDKYIEPGKTALGYPWYGSHWSLEEILSSPMRLLRCVNWVNVPVAQRPIL